jgi:hypothetical protein
MDESCCIRDGDGGETIVATDLLVTVVESFIGVGETTHIEGVVVFAEVEGGVGGGVSLVIEPASCIAVGRQFPFPYFDER